jgi:deazaflavin-dependent oxidoreductase (nitroreductase family)
MWFNPIMIWLLRSPLHGLLSGNTMLITVRGRKSGREWTTPVNYVRHREDLLAVSFRSRTWWRNLRGRPTPVVCLVAGKARSGTATVVETTLEVEAGLSELIARARSFARPLGIGLDASGVPIPADLTRSAQDRVFIRTRLTDLD